VGLERTAERRDRRTFNLLRGLAQVDPFHGVAAPRAGDRGDADARPLEVLALAYRFKEGFAPRLVVSGLVLGQRERVHFRQSFADVLHGPWRGPGAIGLEKLERNQ